MAISNGDTISGNEITLEDKEGDYITTDDHTTLQV
jgi:hypothetical protein